MAKTNFENGTIVEDEFLDLVFSHVHDGADNDGHVAKIDLTAAANITGTLPIANIAAIGSDDVDNDSNFPGDDVTAALNDAATRIGTIEGYGSDDIGNDSNFPGDDVTAALNDAASRIGTVEERCIITELSGIMELSGFAANKNVNYYAQIREYKASDGDENIMKIADVWLPQVMDTATDVYLSIVSTTIPAALRPVHDQRVLLGVVEAGGYGSGFIEVTTTGDWAIRNYNGNNFTNGNAKGISAGIIRILLSIT